MSPRRVVVLGSGVSGLSFAYYLTTFSSKILSVPNAVLPQVTVLEKASHVGGWMTSRKDELTGAVFENGPRSLRATGYEARTSLALAEELGLSNEVVNVSRTSPAGKNRLIYCDGKLNPLPSGVLSLLRAQPPLTKSLASILWKEMRVPSPPELKGQDESIHSFISRRFGLEVADRLVDPFLRGIIAGDLRTTSIKAMFPRLKTVEELHGSIVRNFRKVPEQATDVVKDSVLCRRAMDEKWAMWSLRSGLGSLPTSIRDALESHDVKVKLNEPCSKLEFDGDKVLVHSAGGVTEADLVVSTVNSRSLSKLLPDYPLLSSRLSSLPIVDVASVSLEYPISPSSIPQAFGHLIPSGEGEETLGLIYDSIVFPDMDRRDKSTTRLTCMIGGAWFNEVLGSNPTQSQVEEIAVRSVSKQLGVKEQPVSVRVNILRDAIPQYPVGFPGILSGINEEIVSNGLPLYVLGPSYYMPGANHCIHLAKVQARKLLEQWDLQDYTAASAVIQ